MVQDGTDKERLGKALRVGALLATLLALAAVVVPRLAFSGGGGSDSDAAASLPAAGVAAAASSDEPAVTTTTTTQPSSPGTAATGTGVTTPPSATTTIATTSTSTTTTTTTPTTTPGIVPVVVPALPPPDDGAVQVALAGVHDGRGGPERAGFFAGDRIGWRIRVTNSGGGYLWGVYAYLELYGPMECSPRRLAAGESAECWAETTAAPGTNSAEAWVTAWTANRMVSDRLSYRITVVAG